MKESYIEPPRFHAASERLITTASEIASAQAAHGYKLTIRQLYYQLVACGAVENRDTSYDNLVALLTKARLAGVLDWDIMDDRSSGFVEQVRWNNGVDALYAAARNYHEDLWEGQEFRVFVVVEKEAIAGSLQRVCQDWDIPLLPARGYSSAIRLREFAKQRIMQASQTVVVLHLGDHDPIGIDMSRDLQERLTLFSREQVQIDFRRIALNMDQVDAQAPPPNPAKVTDSRYNAYRKQFGDKSWELEALSPAYLHKLVTDQVESLLDFNIWNQKCLQVEKTRMDIETVASAYEEEQR